MFDQFFRERRRSAAVLATGVLNTPAEPAFDRFVQLAASAFDAPISLMTLIHNDRQWCKAARGLTIGCIPRDASFCRYAIDRPGLLECCNPTTDLRFAALPVVTGEPHIRYYLGAPLHLFSGVDVGALCVLDVVPRAPASADQRAYLAGLARQAARALEARSGALFGRAA